MTHPIEKPRPLSELYEKLAELATRWKPPAPAEPQEQAPA